jgi:glycosyltransferase involved in cell wall biosynthesis
LTSAEIVLVIIPTFNRATLLPEAIQSVLDQDYAQTRMVVIDDGSTDDTSVLCAEYQRRYPTRFLYEHQSKGGCAKARNQGLAHIDESIGFVCFLDSDDRLLPGKLSREVRLLGEHPSADFTYSDSIVFDEMARQEGLRKVASAGRPEGFALEHFLTNEAKCAALLYRRAIFQKLRFREDLRHNEDSEFLHRVAILYRGVYCPEPGCWVRWHAGSKSRDLVQGLKAVLSADLDIIAAYPEFYSDHYTKMERRIREIRSQLFRNLILSGRWAEAREYSQSASERLLALCHCRAYYRLRGWAGRMLNGVRDTFC